MPRINLQASTRADHQVQRSRRGFTLVVRVIIFVIGCQFLFLMGKLVFSMRGQADLATLAMGGLIAAFGGMAGLGAIYISLFWRRQTRGEMKDELATPLPDQPDLPESAERYVFSTGWRAAAVFIDSQNRQVHFRNCHVPRGFLTSAHPWFTCQADDVLGVHVSVGRGGSQTLTVVTQTGKVTVPGTARGYSELVYSLKKLVPENQQAVLSADHPMMGYVLIFAVLLGIFGGWSLAPRAGSDAVVVLFIFAGAFAAGGACFLLSQFGTNETRKRLPAPAVFGLAGALVGLVMGVAIGRALVWNTTMLIALGACGGVFGVLFGFTKQWQEKQAIRRIMK